MVFAISSTKIAETADNIATTNRGKCQYLQGRSLRNFQEEGNLPVALLIDLGNNVYLEGDNLVIINRRRLPREVIPVYYANYQACSLVHVVINIVT